MTSELIRPNMTAEEFAQFGAKSLAYIRQIRSDDVHKHFLQALGVAPGMTLFILSTGDGAPVMITDTRNVALSNASDHDLNTVSVH